MTPPLLAVQDGIIPPLDMTVLEAYRIAHDAGMYLITDGFRTVIAPYIPPGWRELPIRIKAANTAEIIPCLS